MNGGCQEQHVYGCFGNPGSLGDGIHERLQLSNPSYPVEVRLCLAIHKGGISNHNHNDVYTRTAEGSRVIAPILCCPGSLSSAVHCSIRTFNQNSYIP